MVKRWLLRLVLLVTGLVNLARVLQAFQWISVLRYPQGFQPELSIPLPAVGITYGFLALSCFVVLITQWNVNRPRPIYYWALGYQAVVWVLHLLTDVSSYSRVLWFRNAALTVVFVLVIYWLARPGKQRHQQHKAT